MDDKKKQKIFNKVMTRIFLALLIGFSALYISEATGYYEFEQHKKVTLTEEKIEQFENDVWYVEHVSFLTDCKLLIRLVQFALDRKNSTAHIILVTELMIHILSLSQRLL